MSSVLPFGVGSAGGGDDQRGFQISDCLAMEGDGCAGQCKSTSHDLGPRCVDVRGLEHPDMERKEQGRMKERLGEPKPPKANYCSRRNTWT